MGLTKQEFVFKKLLEDFLTQLKSIYPNERFGMYLQLLLFSGDLLIPTIISETKATMSEYSEHILQRNAEFFIELDNKAFTTDALVLKEIGRLKSLYFLPETTDDIKNCIWDYIHKIYTVVTK